MTRIPIVVPSDERRVLLRTFWLTVSSFVVLPLFLLAMVAGDIAPAVAGASFAGMAAYVVLAREDLAWRIYRAWNRRIVRPFAAAGSSMVLAVCYAVVVVAAHTGARKAACTHRHSTWSSRRSLPSDAYQALFAGTRADAAEFGWVRNYVRWARRTDRLWATSLVPFLAILRLLAENEPQAPHENIYTLF